MKTIKLSSVSTFSQMNNHTDMINFMLDNGFDTLVNDYSESGMEYEIDDIEDSWFVIVEYKKILHGN
jgi:hypothetical protein